MTSVDDGIFDAGARLNGAALHDDAVLDNSAGFDGHMAEEDTVFNGSLDSAACSDERIAYLAVRHILGGNSILDLGHDRCFGIEYVSADIGVEQVKAVLVVRLSVADVSAVAVKLAGSNVHLVEVELDSLEDIEVVDSRIPLNELEQEVGSDDEALDECRLALCGVLGGTDNSVAIKLETHQIGAAAAVGGIEHGDVGAALKMSLAEVIVVDVGNYAGRGNDNILRAATTEKLLIGGNILEDKAGIGMAQTIRGSGQNEETAALSIESPGLAGADMVEQGTVSVGSDNAYRSEPEVHHIGKREIYKAVSAAIGKRSYSAMSGERFAAVVEIISCDDTGNLLH